MKPYRVSAVVIARRNFSEKDRILTLFSLQHGKMDVVVKGARRPGSRLSYVSDLGTIADFLVTKTRSIDIVTEAKTIFLPDSAFGDLGKSNKIFYALKVASKLYHEEEPHPKTYKALTDLIVSSEFPSSQLNFLIFIKEIVDDLGISPRLDRCIHCLKEVKSSESFVFELQGGISHLGCARGEVVDCSIGAMKLMRLIFYEGSFSVKSRVDQDIFEETYKILKSYISWHFQEILPELSSLG